jgi:hypothetical protein
VTTLHSVGSKETHTLSDEHPEPRTAGQSIFLFLAERKNRMSSKLAFPQFAQLEQNLQISYHVRDSCESQPRYKMPAYSVVKDLCVRIVRTVPLLAGRSLAFFQKVAKQ